MRSGSNRAHRLWPVTVVVLAVGLLAPATGAGAAPPTCAPANLRVDTVGAMGFTSHQELDVALRNVGTGTCQLKGFPGVGFLGAAAGPIKTTVSHMSGPPKTVTLKPWQAGFFGFTYTTNGPCSKSLFAHGVRVVPPGASQRLVLFLGKTGVCGPAPALVTVTPVLAKHPF